MKFTKYLIAVLTIAAVFPMKGICQNKEVGYTLSCTFKGLPDKTKVYLTTQDKDTVQRSLSEGDRVTFKGKMNPDGRFHFIKFDTLVSNVGTKAIFLSNKSIIVKGSIGKKELEVIGSPEQEEYLVAVQNRNEVQNQINQIDKEKNELSQKISDSLSKIADLTDSMQYLEYRKHLPELNKFDEKIKSILGPQAYRWLLDHKRSLVSTYIMQHYLASLQPEQAKEIFAAFSPEVKDSYYGRIIKLEIEAAHIVKGLVIPNFPLKNIQGKEVEMHDLIKSNKYTLIDCWASWCSPCRAEVPALKEIYGKYKDKGLNILGISSDKREADWKKAVTEDKTTWGHVLQISGNLDKVFRLGSIPAYILVDSNGKLVAFDCAMSTVPNFGGSLRGEGLDRTLETLLGK